MKNLSNHHPSRFCGLAATLLSTFLLTTLACDTDEDLTASRVESDEELLEFGDDHLHEFDFAADSEIVRGRGADHASVLSSESWSFSQELPSEPYSEAENKTLVVESDPPRRSCRGPRGEITWYNVSPGSQTTFHQFGIENVGIVDSEFYADYNDYEPGGLSTGGFISSVGELLIGESANSSYTGLTPNHTVVGRTIAALPKQAGGGTGCTGTDSKNRLYELEIRRGFTGVPWRVSGRIEWWSTSSDPKFVQMEYLDDNDNVVGRVSIQLSQQESTESHGAIAYFDLLLVDPPDDNATRVAFFDRSHVPMRIMN